LVARREVGQAAQAKPEVQASRHIDFGLTKCRNVLRRPSYKFNILFIISWYGRDASMPERKPRPLLQSIAASILVIFPACLVLIQDEAPP
jgi:hypothetical protein